MSQSESNNTTQNVRLDKWLWAARFFKTRAIARDMVQSGKVQYNGQRTKPGKHVELGAMIKVPAGWDNREIKVLGLSDKRLSAPLAQALFEETAESVTKREENQAARKLSAFHSPKPDHRPDKKQRRQIIKFKQQ
ncbi:heat-shock protein [Alteromonas mediterranea]|jgi:ribosome-associated heat shock protein Hsp15|uniref:Heat shock protein 15 n=3 Tax=Alteromonas mediterranea TaxID=314275 RepID=A0AAC9JDM6_9ALTE|nr:MULTISPECIES: ribosome-associated heat shock protein Hsp15 [Alteromonas]AGP95401.1 heat shock protein 15 [Alteromonas mediterranea U8]MBR9785388.1 ribosome-associated heat shock protein Hsp15 [Gammaproteobacteria bacterium]MDY6885218.1 ribosome-associated heat shock protein Hsp15 [Pseudomonadota bacterium]AFV87381.1 heat shock protein 15 [Alteromonas mediterranea DE1]AGP83661.1 heat shock protein 15 [Alteromonas mediterranea MED64]|tara:strand:+ start:70 stop:474 length:405 start_codon:yes stop_codon:yes gene_type:complete